MYRSVAQIGVHGECIVDGDEAVVTEVDDEGHAEKRVGERLWFIIVKKIRDCLEARLRKLTRAAINDRVRSFYEANVSVRDPVPQVHHAAHGR